MQQKKKEMGDEIKMSSEAVQDESPLEETAVKKGTPHLRLTKRDEAILVFLLDQKFATIKAIYLKFFDQRKSSSEPVPSGFYTVRQRLLLLQKHGFVKSQKVYTENRSVYLLGGTGYKILQARGLTYGPRTQTVDFRQYEHDLKVTYCRIALERQGKAVRWFSERRLRMKGFEIKGRAVKLSKRSIIPDGIFLSPKGELIAFELECSERMLSRFERKISDYRTLMYEGVVHKVLWVAGTDKLAKDLAGLTKGRERFFLDRYETFSKCLLPGGVL